jgi:sulfur transfer complex TusBCD TusB component (DsrH family)
MDKPNFISESELRAFKIKEDLGNIIVKVSVISKPYLVKEGDDIRSYCDCIITLYHNSQKIKSIQEKLPYFHLNDDTLPRKLMREYAQILGANAIINYHVSGNNPGYNNLLETVKKNGQAEIEYSCHIVRLKEKFYNKFLKFSIRPKSSEDDNIIIITTTAATI